MEEPPARYPVMEAMSTIAPRLARGAGAKARAQWNAPSRFVSSDVGPDLVGQPVELGVLHRAGGAGVVDERVNLAEVVHNPRGHPPHPRVVGHVGGLRDRVAAQRPSPLDGGPRLGGRFAVRDGDRAGAGPGERERAAPGRAAPYGVNPRSSKHRRAPHHLTPPCGVGHRVACGTGMPATTGRRLDSGSHRQTACGVGWIECGPCRL
ncbi:hypothetical protein GCM10023170_091290 [Phytohabitans houttuyneae]|uniref:Uncharacterized protein n=1 Tax=Phytohabitans houttuyneae TaxID=1076126 RepID=A0A6V8KM74_9ACTN|nr:hypothetical protein Phou_086900 [Phytohabitans houttuyneae]